MVYYYFYAKRTRPKKESIWKQKQVTEYICKEMNGRITSQDDHRYNLWGACYCTIKVNGIRSDSDSSYSTVIVERNWVQNTRMV